MHQDPCDVMSELIVVSRELLRLGDTGQEVAPTQVCAMLRARRNVLQSEMRTQLRAASLARSEPPTTGDRDSVPTVRPPTSSARLRASAPRGDSPNQARAQRKEGP